MAFNLVRQQNFEIPPYVHVQGVLENMNSKKAGKDQDSIHSSTTPEPGHHLRT